MQGLHLLAEWYGCSAQLAPMCRAEALQALCEQLTREAGLSVVGAGFHQFQPQGATGTESGWGTLDIFVCNYSGDNSAKAEQLYAALKQSFQPQQEQLQRLQRGAAGAA